MGDKRAIQSVMKAIAAGEVVAVVRGHHLGLHWIGVGVLQSQEIMLRGQQCRVVSPQQLLAFWQTYVPFADLAKATSTKSSSLATTLTGLDVVEARLLPNGKKEAVSFEWPTSEGWRPLVRELDVPSPLRNRLANH